MDAMETTLEKAMPDAEADVRRVLSEEGFGVLSEIDVAATLRAKLGVSRTPLKILGACNPSLAHRALELDPSLALVLPCNVVLEDMGASRTHVAIADPRSLIGFGASAEPSPLMELGEDAADALGRVVGRLGG